MKTFQQAIVAASILLCSAMAEESSTLDGFAPSKNMSNDLTGRSLIGCILGYSVFGIMYIFTIINIFMDMNKNGKEFDALV